MEASRHEAIAAVLMVTDHCGAQTQPFTEIHPEFDLEDGYAVLAAIGRRREADGWQMVGRKIGFTNTAVWPFFDMSAPLWAPVWDRSVHHADGPIDLSLAGTKPSRLPWRRRRARGAGVFTEPRIEAEIVFGLRGPVGDDPLDAIEWMAAGFEIVRCPFPGWRFGLPDAAAAFGLHGALVVGPRVPVGDAAAIAAVEVTISCDGVEAGRGTGANVLGSPVDALAQVAAVIAGQRDAPPLGAGELVTTGTITDPLPVAAGQVWTADYGALGLVAPTLRLT